MFLKIYLLEHLFPIQFIKKNDGNHASELRYVRVGQLDDRARVRGSDGEETHYILSGGRNRDRYWLLKKRARNSDSAKRKGGCGALVIITCLY